MIHTGACRHQTHIGFDKEKGLSFDVDTIPDEWLDLFTKAGVTKQQLQNPEDRKFIFDFVAQNQGSMPGTGAQPANPSGTHNTSPQCSPPCSHVPL